MGFTERLARACAAKPRRTLAFWGIGVLVALVLVATSLHGLTSNSNVIGSPDSTKAADAIARAFPNAPAAEKHDVIVVSSTRYAARSPQFRRFLEQQAAKLTATGKVSGLRVAAVSPDGHAVLVSVSIDSDSDAKQVESVVQKANGSGFSAGITGYRSANYDFGRQSQKDLESGELSFGLPAALIVLVLVFGAVIAGLVPVMMAILSIIVALGLVALLSLAFSLSVFIVNMLTGMGLALGIDYSLFVVSRFREERTLGLEKLDAIAHAGATASRAVLFSGSTFVVALVGMFIVPTSIMRSLALGAILVGIVSVVAALTLLPALLSLLGDRVNALRVPYLGRNLGKADALEGRFWRRIVETVLRRPAVFLLVTVAAILAAASPIFGLHIGANGVNTLPNSLPSKQGYVLLQHDFPGNTPEPVNIVALGASPTVRADLLALQGVLANDPRFGPGKVQTSQAQDVSLLSVPVRGDSA
ncbi:MAG: MMPL family transporter, partial [Actinobacteria bacterium]|nr:MMPL family transporter [Actinomycetota bacterium]